MDDPGPDTPNFQFYQPLATSFLERATSAMASSRFFFFFSLFFILQVEICIFLREGKMAIDKFSTL